MLRKIAIAAGLAGCLVSAPAMAAGDAAAGMADMSKYNLIVLGNWAANSDVEGRAIVTGNATGSSVTVGMGRTAAGQSSTPSTDPTLVIGGNLSVSNVNVNNGSNGGSGNIAPGSSVWVKGNASGNINLNSASGRNLLIGGNSSASSNNIDSLQIGGNMTGGNFNSQAGGSIKIGGTKTGGTINLNGATYQPNLGAGFKSGLEAAVNGMTSTLGDDLRAFSTQLSGLTLGSNPSYLSSSGQTLILNAVKGSNGFSLFNLSQTDFTGFTSIAYNFNPDAGPVIVNFTGATVGPDIVATLGLNFVTLNGLTDDFTKVNQSIVWNFKNATKVNFTTEFFGSVLATEAEVKNNNAINGSVVAKKFTQGGEVHLGTFDSFTFPPPPAVPEPATWAMMILGFGLVGAVRRREARVRFA
ncbi:MAG: choice-of-anchor A family protein [Sphingobium sp.]|nr:choice-of-anchor A family protein [Sphingobium sp.]